MKIQSTFFVVLGLVLTFACSQLHATLLVYNGFDHGGADIDLHNVTVTANSQGLTGNYDNLSNTSGQSFTFIYDADAGLSFGSNYFSGTGGAVYSSAQADTNPSHVLDMELDLSSAVSGTLYSSYLLNYRSFGTETFITTVRAADAGRTNTRFNAALDFGGGASSSDIGVSTSYDTSRVATDYLISSGTTYLLLSSFTNVGNAGGGTAATYLFDQTAYDNWYNAGSVEGDLGSFALSSVTETVGSGTFSFADGEFIDYTNFVSNAGGHSPYVSVDMDEMRWGTELSDVVSVIPEPSSLILLLLGLPILRWGLRRRS